MKVAVYYSNSDVRIEERERPRIGEGELLVKVMASGICGSDVMEWYRIKKAPLVLGHEIAGVVEEVGPAKPGGSGEEAKPGGSAVKSAVKRFKPGDRVTVAHHVPCMTCRYCLSGEHSVCDMLRTTNFDPGGFAEYVRVPSVNVDRGTFILPEQVSFAEGSFSEPLGCVVRGFRRSGTVEGRGVLVIGSGISGLLHILLARALGAQWIAATDISDFRRKAAKKAGADLVLDAASDIPGELKKKFGRGADIVALCASPDSAIEQALKSVDRGGTVIFFAPKAPGVTFPMPLFDLWRDNITIVNTYASPPEDTLDAIDLLALGRVDVKGLITHTLSLDEAPEGFRLVDEAGESIKVIIEPNRQ